ncbi:MAG: hypothetical protein ACOX3Y_00415 [Clostridia bacterium]|jgi:hypothetical protein
MLMDFLTEPTQSTALIMLPLLLLLSAWIIFRLLLREFYCWYYKINKTVKLLENIDEKLGKLVDHFIPDSQSALSPGEDKAAIDEYADTAVKGEVEKRS